MTYDHDEAERPPRVREPVQVYLDRDDQARLERLTGQLGTSKSDVLRRGLGALERQLSDPSEHPALRLVGILGESTGPGLAYDVAREHDRFLTDTEEGSWSEEASWPDPEEPAGR